MMNHQPQGQIPLTKAVVGFVSHKLAESVRDRTIDQYKRLLGKWVEKSGDKEVGQVSSKEIRDYLNWLRTDYEPIRKNGKTHPLSPNTIRNVWVCLSSFFRWASMEISPANPMENVSVPLNH